LFTCTLKKDKRSQKYFPSRYLEARV